MITPWLYYNFAGDFRQDQDTPWEGWYFCRWPVTRILPRAEAEAYVGGAIKIKATRTKHKGSVPVKLTKDGIIPTIEGYRLTSATVELIRKAFPGLLVGDVLHVSVILGSSKKEPK